MTPEDVKDYEAWCRLTEKYGTVPRPAALYYLPNRLNNGAMPAFVVAEDKAVYSLQPVLPQPWDEGHELAEPVLYLDDELASELRMEGVRAFCQRHLIDPVSFG